MKKYRILSLDGGGIRGLMTALWLEELEAQKGSPLNQHFDLIAGTSTGSILAAAIGLGIPASAIVKLYRQHGESIFPQAASRRWDRITRVFAEGFSAPKYSPDGLEKALKKIFKTATLDQLAKPTLIFTYNVFAREPVVFKNYRTAFAKIPIWEAVRASCSAPTYFPAMVMKLGKASQPLVDGGVAANNPSACAVAEGIKLNAEGNPANKVDLDDFILASFGTGSSTRPISIKEAQEWGALEWAIPIIDVLFDGSTDTSDYIAQQIIHTNNYFRFQVPLDAAYDDMDKADPVNLNALSSIADNYIKGPAAKQMAALAAAL